MLIEPELLTTGTRVVTGLASGAALVAAVATAPWRAWLSDHERQWVWLGFAGCLVALWSMKAGISAGLSLRFLLITAYVLLNGWQLALLGSSLALGVLCFTGQAAWSSFGADLLCIAVVPALFTAWFHEQVHARLPHNYFIYFFVTVYLGSALAFNLAGLARIGVLLLGGTLDSAHVGAEYFALLPMMSFGEGVVNGMVMAMCVVYKPRWVMSFDDRLYLRKRPDPPPTDHDPRIDPR